MRGLEAAVAAHVEVPAELGRDDPDILAAGLGALSGAAGHPELELVRRAQPAVAQLQVDRHGDGVLHAEPAPRRSDTTLHGAQRLPVGLPGLEAGVDEDLPDLGQLLQAGPEQVDPLPAGDLRVQAEVRGDLGDHLELGGGDLAARDAGHHRVGAVLLHVRERPVVGVLQRAPAGVEDVAGRLGGQDRGDHGLADVTAEAAAEPVHDLLERGQLQDAHRLEQFAAALRDVLAERAGDVDSGPGQLGLEDLLDQGDAGTALGAGAGAGLERPEFGAGLAVAGRLVTADGGAHGADRDVVAGAELHVVGQVGAGRRFGAGRREVGARFGGELPAEQGAEGGVRPGVTDEDAAEQRLRIVRDDDLLVETPGRVGVDDLEGVRGGGQGVAEARDLDPGQLEPGGVVDAGEHRGAAVQPVGDDLGHRVGRRDEPDADPADAGHLADRPDPGDGGSAVLADRDPAARAPFEPGQAGEFVAGGDPDGEDDQVGVQGGAVGEADAEHAAGRRGEDLGRPVAEGEADALGLDQPAEGLAGALVELGAHQPAAGVHDRGEPAEPGQPARGLEAEQPAADDDDVRGPAEPVGEPRHLGAEEVDVLDRAIDVAGRSIGDRRDAGRGAGREDELVVAEGLTAVEGHGARRRVEPGHPALAAETDAGGAPEGTVAQGEVLGVDQPAGQRDPVIGEVRLLADHRDAVAPGAAGRHRLGEPVRGRAAADHDHPAGGAGLSGSAADVFHG